MLIPVILSGGSGTRLWPLSRELYPKQLLPLVGKGTMLQETLARVAGVAGVAGSVAVRVHVRGEHDAPLVAERDQHALERAAIAPGDYRIAQVDPGELARILTVAAGEIIVLLAILRPWSYRRSWGRALLAFAVLSPWLLLWGAVGLHAGPRHDAVGRGAQQLGQPDVLPGRGREQLHERDDAAAHRPGGLHPLAREEDEAGDGLQGQRPPARP